MDLPTEYFCRYFEVEITDGKFPSVIQSVITDRNFSVCNSVGNYRRNKNPSVYFKRESFFFGAQIPSVKPSANGFFVFPTDIATEWGITNEGKSDGRNPTDVIRR